MSEVSTTTDKITKSDLKILIDKKDNSVDIVQLAGYSNFSRIVYENIDTDYVRCFSIIKYVSSSNNSGIVKHKCKSTKILETKPAEDQTISKFMRQLPSNKLKSECTERLTEFITRSNRPFQLADDGNFIRFAQYLIDLGASRQTSIDAKHLIPHSTTVSRRIDILYEEKVQVLCRKLNEINSVVITVDHWDDIFNNNKYLGIVAKYLDLELHKLRSSLLCFKKIDDATAKTSDTILTKYLTRFQIIDKELFAVSDNARNMKALFKDYKWVGCSAHQLNTILKNTFSDNELNKNVVDLVKNVKRFVERVNKTKKYNVSLKNDLDVRFDSKYLMFESVCRNIERIKSFEDKNLEQFLNVIDIDLLKKVKYFLQFFYECRLFLCKDDSPTINLVLPVYCKIKTFLSQSEKDDSRIQDLKKTYSKYFFKFVITDIHKQATFLTPKFKEMNGLLDKNERESLLKSLEILINEEPNVRDSFSFSEDSASNDFFSDFVTKKNKRMRITSEIERYSDSIITNKIDTLSFWITNKIEYPKLSNLALKILSISATSCRIEEIFSQSGIMLSSKRSSMLPEKANKNLFLNVNKDL